MNRWCCVLVFCVNDFAMWNWKYDWKVLFFYGNVVCNYFPRVVSMFFVIWFDSGTFLFAN